MLPDGSNTIVESQDVMVVEDVDLRLLSEADNNFIEFDISDEGVIFDKMLRDVNQFLHESNSVREPNMQVAVDSQRENEIAESMNLDDITPFPRLRRSERGTA